MVIRRQGHPSHGGPNADPNRCLVRQCCMNLPTTKFKRYDTSNFQKSGQLYTSESPSEKCCNETLLSPLSMASTRAYTAPSPMANMGKHNKVSTKTASVLCLGVFYQDEPSFSPAVPTNNAGSTAPPSGNAPMAQSRTDTATPESVIPTAISGGKSSSNCTQPMDGLGAESKLAANRKSDVTLTANSGASNANSYYSESGNNLLVSSKNRTELAAQLNKPKKCTGTSGKSLNIFPYPGSSSPIPARSTLQSLLTWSPTQPKKPIQWNYVTALDPDIFAALNPNRHSRSPRQASVTSLH